MGSSSRRLFLHCANSDSSQVHAGLQMGPNGAEM